MLPAEIHAPFLHGLYSAALHGGNPSCPRRSYPYAHPKAPDASFPQTEYPRSQALLWIRQSGIPVQDWFLVPPSSLPDGRNILYRLLRSTSVPNSSIYPFSVTSLASCLFCKRFKEKRRGRSFLLLHLMFHFC